MEVDTNELLHRIGAVLRGISNKMDRLIELGEKFERASRSQEMPEGWGEHEGDHFVGAGKMVAEEPPKRWRRLDPAEIIEPGDWMNAMTNSQDKDPPDGGWRPVAGWLCGQPASAEHGLYFARPVTEEPADEPAEVGYRPVDDGDIGKIVEVQNSPLEPWSEGTLLAIAWAMGDGFLCSHSEPSSTARRRRWRFARIKIDEPAKEPVDHPAGPKPDPGDGYRILVKHPPEDLTPSDEWWDSSEDRWCGIFPSDTTIQHPRVWYRRKIEVAKEPEHPAGPKPDPGEGYRLLSKDPPEDLQPGDDCDVAGVWVTSEHARTHKIQHENTWYRRKIEVANEPEQEYPAGVVPDQGEGCCEPTEKGIGGDIEVIATASWIHGRRSPAEPPASEKPAEPEYREPVLPADAGKVCEFSIDGNAWTEAKLRGYAGYLWQSVSSEVVGAKHWVHARIKKES